MPVSLCPGVDQLAAFQAGRLPPAAINEIGAHLESCASCHSAVVKAPVIDTLVHELRKGMSEDPFAAEPGCRRAVAGIAALAGASEPTKDHGQACDTDDSGRPQPGLERSLGRYQLLEEIGKGGMGRVYKAFHTVLKKTVAVKVLPAERLGSQEAIQRFRREIEAAGRLDHPHIVRASDADFADGQHFLVMEWLDGLDLERFILAHQPLPMREACDFLRQAALGLQCAHENGLVHRDVKPSNLLVNSTPSGPIVKVLDLGLARLHDEGRVAQKILTADNAIMGTFDFIAPEQIGSSQVDGRADIYSLGCTAYYVLTGRPPFADKQRLQKLSAHEREAPPPLTKLRPEIPSQVVAIVARMTAKKPEDRYQTMAEVAEAWAAARTTCAESDKEAPATDNVQWRPRWLVIAAAAALLVAAGAWLIPQIVIRLKGPDGDTIVKVPPNTPIEITKDGKTIFKSDGEKKTTTSGSKKEADVKKEPQPVVPDDAEKRLRIANHLARARQAAEKQLHEVVIAEFDEVLRLDPKNTAALHGRGITHGLQGRFGLLVADLESATAIDPDKGDYFNMSWGYINTGDLEKCVWAASEAIRRQKIPAAYMNRVLAFQRLGQFELALADAKTMIQANPQNAWAWYHAAQNLKTLGDEKQGQEHYAQAGKVGPAYLKTPCPPLELPPFQRFAGHASGQAWKILFSGSELLYSCGSDGVIRCWEIATGRQRRTFEGHGGEVLALALSSDGTTLVSGGRDATIRVWNTDTGKEVRRLEGITRDSWGLAFAPDDRRVVGDAGGGEKGHEPGAIWDRDRAAPILRLDGHANAVAFHPDGKHVLGGTSAGDLRIFDAQSGKTVRELVGHNQWVRNVALSPDGKHAASVSHVAPLGDKHPSDETFAILWDWSSGQRKATLSHRDRVHGLAFAPSNRYVATGGLDNSVRLWDVSNGKEVWNAQAPSAILSLAYSPSGAEIAASCKDGMLRLWRLPRQLVPPPPAKGVWKSTEAEYKAIYNKGAASVRQWMDVLKSEGFRPIYYSSQSGAAEPRFNAIAVKDGKEVPWHFSQKLTPKERDTGDFRAKMNKANFYIRATLHYEIGGELFCDQIFFPRDQQGWGNWGGSQAALQGVIDEQRKGIVRPAHLSSHKTPEMQLFTGGFIPIEGLTWDVAFAVAPTDLAARIRQLEERNWLPEFLTSYIEDGKLKFMMVMVENKDRRPWSFKMDLTEQDLERGLEASVAAAQRPASIDAYVVGNQTKYALVLRSMR